MSDFFHFVGNNPEIIFNYILLALLGGAAGYLLSIKNKFKAVYGIMRVMAKKQIEYTYHKHKRNCRINIYEKADILELGKAYEILGGNGRITQMLEEIKTWKDIEKE